MSLKKKKKKKKKIIRSHIIADRPSWPSPFNGFSEMLKGKFELRLDNLPIRMVWIKAWLNKKLNCCPKTEYKSRR